MKKFVGGENMLLDQIVSLKEKMDRVVDRKEVP